MAAMTTARQATLAWLDEAPPSRRGRRVFVAVLGILLVVFALTASWTRATNDPLTNAISGWYLGNEGTVVLDQHEDLYAHQNLVAWVVESPRGAVSQYPPGAAAIAAVAYALAPGDELAPTTIHVSRTGEDVTFLQPPIWPATLTAVLVTALACALLGVVFLDLGRRPVEAVVAGVLAGVATGAWSVAANMSWQHGPAMLAIAAAMLAASRERWWLAGLALGAGVLVRPHLAVVAAVLGVGVSLARRRLLPIIAVGVGSGLGLAALVAYNWYVWGTLTISGGYGSGFEERLTAPDPWWFVRNVALGLVSPVNGVLVWAPFLVVLGVGAWLARRQLPDWTIAAALGGVAYLLVQWKANRYTGGAAFFAYRYPLEAMVAAAPALYVGWDRWVRDRPTPRRILGYLLLVAVVGQAVGAILS